MPKESWKIDKFEGGINDYTDSKDIKPNEFVELQDCSVAKIGQVKNLGKPVVSESIPQISVIPGVDIDADGDLDVNTAIIPGRGFFRFPNDYSLGAISSSGSAVVTVEQTTAASNGVVASCEFEVINMLWVFSAVGPLTEGNLLFRLQCRHPDTEALLPSGTSGFDASIGWEVVDLPSLSAASFLDNYTHVWNQHSFTPTSGSAHGPWFITSRIQSEIGYTNERVLGGSTYKAIGFYKYAPMPGADINDTTFYMPRGNFEAGEVFFGNQLQYQLMRHSFNTEIVKKINALTSTPDIIATQGEFGSGTIRLAAHQVGTTLNGYEIHATSIAQSIVNGTSVTTPDILESATNVNSNKASGGVFSISGNNVFSGGTAAVANVWKIKIEGPAANNDLVYVSIFMEDGNDPQGTLDGSPFAFYSTHVQLATAIASAANNVSGITGTVDTSNATYTYAILTASSTGITNQFSVEINVTIRENFFDIHANDEQHVLLSLSDKSILADGLNTFGMDIWGNDMIGDSGTYNNLLSHISGYEETALNIRGVKLNIFASSLGTWSSYNGEGIFMPTSDLNGHKSIFDWVWNPEFGIYPEPSFSNDSNRLIMVDGNFNLPNYNMWFGYSDRSKFFPLRANYPNAEHFHGYALMKKWYKWPERKAWSFTQYYAQGEKNPHWCWNGISDANGQADNNYGVITEGDANMSTFSTGGYNPDASAQMQWHFEKEEDNDMGTFGYIDWGGAQPEEDEDGEVNENQTLFEASEIKWYLAAVYDDGSESLPSHKFTFGGLDYQTYEWNQWPKIEFMFRPLSAVLQSIVETGQSQDDAMIMGQQCFPDPRVRGVRLYYTDSIESHQVYWNVMLIDFERGLIPEGRENPSKAWYHVTENEGFQQGNAALVCQVGSDNPTRKNDIYKKPKGKTYEFFNGFNPLDIETLSVRYKYSTLAANRMFIANIEVEGPPNIANRMPGTKRYYNDRMVMSTVGKYSTFPYPDNIFDLNISDGDEITALATVQSKILQFKRGILYIVDISSGVPEQFYVSDRLIHKGIESNNHWCETSAGIFFFNNFGAWIYDGEELKDIFVNKDDEDKKQQRIDPGVWKTFVIEASMCAFNPLSNEVIILKNHTHSSSAATGDCYIYHLYADAWTYGSERFHGENTATRELTNFSQVGANLQTSFMAKTDDVTESNCKLYSWEYEGQSTGNFQIVTKVTDLGDPQSYKSILGLIINAVQGTADSAYTLAIEWREGPGNTWSPLDNISNASTNTSTVEGLSHTHMFNPPVVKGIKTLQLKIVGSEVQGDFGINDINLIFRKYRTSDLKTFKAEVD